MEYLVREAKPADLEAIIRLCAEHAAYEQDSYSPEGKAEKLGLFLFVENPRLYCLLAENEDGIIGYATYMLEFSTWNAGYFTHLDCLYLRPHARGFGIGEALVKTIARQSIAKGCTQMQWQTPVFNERAIKFYERIGAKAKQKLRFCMDEGAIKKWVFRK